MATRSTTQTDYDYERMLADLNWAGVGEVHPWLWWQQKKERILEYLGVGPWE